MKCRTVSYSEVLFRVLSGQAILESVSNII